MVAAAGDRAQNGDPDGFARWPGRNPLQHDRRRTGFGMLLLGKKKRDHRDSTPPVSALFQQVKKVVTGSLTALHSKMPPLFHSASK
jgi:hypothetical protein